MVSSLIFRVCFSVFVVRDSGDCLKLIRFTETRWSAQRHLVLWLRPTGLLPTFPSLLLSMPSMFKWRKLILVDYKYVIVWYWPAAWHVLQGGGSGQVCQQGMTLKIAVHCKRFVSNWLSKILAYCYSSCRFLVLARCVSCKLKRLRLLQQSRSLRWRHLLVMLLLQPHPKLENVIR